jgi:hypothetical protein
MNKSYAVFGLAFLAIILLLVGSAVSEEFCYEGATKCKLCHNSAKKGQQYTVWSKSAHSQAYNRLASEEAKKVAKAKGIEDPQKSEKCLKCHAPAFNVKTELKGEKFDITEGVTCENCHGPGSAYKKITVMKAIYSGKEKGEKYGMLTVDEDTCKKCHNEESPTYDKSKPFDFAQMLKKIDHRIPKEQPDQQ